MIFADLLKLGHDGCGNIYVGELKFLLPGTPDYIIENLYSHHGRKPEFQSQYSGIRIDEVRWRKETLTANTITRSEIYQEFSGWMSVVRNRVERFEEEGRACIDVRDDVVAHWQRFRTWMTPPIAIRNELIRNSQGLWLVEGHTRLGILQALVEQSIIDGDSLHEIWIGS